MASTVPEQLVLHLHLMALEPVAEEGRLLRRALGVDQQRQIAADAHGIHVVEEDGAMATEQVLDVVLGVGDQHIDAGIVHEPVEALGVEGNGWLGDVEHGSCSLGAGYGRGDQRQTIAARRVGGKSRLRGP
jgi:hypothetical protein